MNLQTRIAELTAQCAARYPLGSEWEHNTVGRVTITRYIVGHNGTPETVFVSPEIRDRTGKIWSCYDAGHDLSPRPTRPSEVRVARDVSDPIRRLRRALRVLRRAGTYADFRDGRPLAADDRIQHPGCSLSMSSSRGYRARQAQARLRVEAAAEAEGWAAENMWQWIAERSVRS